MIMRLTHTGTVAWMAPEVIRNEPCSEKVDVWLVQLYDDDDDEINFFFILISDVFIIKHHETFCQLQKTF